jgi:hypothetical protein
MRYRLLTVLVFVAVLTSMLGMASTVMAASSITFGSPTINFCNLTTVQIAAGVQANVDAGDILYFRIEVEGVTVLNKLNVGTGPTTVNYPLSGGWSFSHITSYPYEAEIFWYFNDGLNEPDYWVATINCTATNTGTVVITHVTAPIPPVADVDEEDPRQIFFDGRVNSYDTGNSVVLFGKPDDNDEWRLEVYNADQTGMLFVVYPDAIAAVAECPESNTLIQSDEATGISLWRLTERIVTAEGVRVCPFQLNAPSTEAGKTYVIIFDTLFPNTYYESGDEHLGN